jgi:glycosyltransferase involved in cell wall biosynthesis
LKIVFATYDSPDDVGGVSSWLQRLLPKLQSAGLEVDVHLLTFGGQPGVNCAAFERLGIPFRWRPWVEDTSQAVRHCLQLLAESQPDIYVPGCLLPAYHAAALVRRQGVHTVGILHSDDAFYWGVVDEFVTGQPVFRLSALVTVSKFLQNAVTALIDNQSIVSRQIGYGVPLSDEVASPPTGFFRLVYIGRVEEEQKRISDVARALCAAAKQNPRVEAWIVGEGSGRPVVEAIIQASGVEPHRVKLLGRVDVARIYSVLRDCHALVLLSDYEGLPVAVLEAMSVGVVPICLDIRSGIREAIQPGFNGLIVQDRQADFYAAVQTLQGDPALWSKLSANARATVRENFSEEICTAAWVELLGSLGKSQRLGRLKMPRRFRLPPVNPKFGLQDNRPSLWQQVWRGFRRFGGRCKRQLWQQLGH